MKVSQRVSAASQIKFIWFLLKFVTWKHFPSYWKQSDTRAKKLMKNLINLAG